MKAITFTDQLLAVSEDLDSITAPELAIMLRRAALRLDTASFPAGEQTTIRADILVTVDKLAAENDLTREFMVAAILRDWLISHGQMAGAAIGKGAETKGSA